MGAAYFEETISGLNLRDAFAEAVREARYQHGHGGYTGTLAEKDQVTELNLESELYAATMRLELRLSAVANIKILRRLTDGEVVEIANIKARLKVLKSRSRAAAKLEDRVKSVAADLMDKGIDKWGPAFALRLTTGKPGKPSTWYVFGSASC